MYSTGIAYILWLLSGFGVLGLHRFYLGKIPTGLLWMFTGGLFGIGAFVDLLTLPGQVREANLRKALFEGMYESNNLRWRSVNDGHSRIIKEKDHIERIILRTAKANKGILTASELAIEAKISIEEAKKDLDVMVTKGYAELRVRQSGSIVYVIPDFMDNEEPLVH